MESANKVVDIKLLNVEEHMFGVTLSYLKIYANGSRKACKKNVQDLGGYYSFFKAKPIVSAVCLGKVYCGALNTDCRILFIVKLQDGSAQLIQVKESSRESLKLFELCYDDV